MMHHHNDLYKVLTYIYNEISSNESITYIIKYNKISNNCNIFTNIVNKIRTNYNISIWSASVFPDPGHMTLAHPLKIWSQQIAFKFASAYTFSGECTCIRLQILLSHIPIYYIIYGLNIQLGFVI